MFVVSVDLIPNALNLIISRYLLNVNILDVK